MSDHGRHSCRAVELVRQRCKLTVAVARDAELCQRVQVESLLEQLLSVEEVVVLHKLGTPELKR
jgi:hypothetical protein